MSTILVQKEMKEEVTNQQTMSLSNSKVQK